MAESKTIREVIRQWKNAGFPEEFKTKTEGGHAKLYFHESFALGSQTYTIDIRPEPDSPELIERRRVALTDGQTLVL